MVRTAQALHIERELREALKDIAAMREDQFGSQTTLYASEGSSGECAILSARIGTQPVRFNIADDLTLTATFPPMPIRWLGSSPTLPPFGISGFQKSLSAADGPTPMEKLRP